MTESAPFYIYLACLTGAVLLSLGGKVNLALLILAPLMPLHNVLYKFHDFALGKDFIDIVLAAMIVGWVIRTYVQNEETFVPNEFNKLLVVLMIYTGISLFLGSAYLGLPPPLDPSDVRLQTWKNYMVLPLLFYITVNNVKTVNQMKWLLFSMFAALFIVELYTARQISWSPGLNSRDKLLGTFVWLGPNQLASFYVTCIFMLLGLGLFVQERLLKLLCIALAISCAGVTMFLYSRAAYVAILAVLTVLAVMRYRLLLVPIILVVMFWQTVLPKNVVDRINETQTAEGELDSSSQHRIELWEESMGLFMSNPLTGIGFDVIYIRGLLGRFKDTHNIFVKVLAEQGVIGMVIFLLLLWRALKTGYLLYREAQDPFLKGLGMGFFLAGVGVIVTNMFGDRWMFLQVGAYYWVFMGMAVRGLILVEENEEEEREEEEAEVSEGEVAAEAVYNE